MLTIEKNVTGIRTEMMISAKNRLKNRRFSEGGLTLIECLVAIAVISITTASIGPMMVFSVATRVQNQKAEQALQLAQGEIDKVRLTVEQGGDYGKRLKDISLIRVPSTTTSVAANVTAPSEFKSTAVDTETARLVDTDGDGTPDFAIQLFRTQGIELPAKITTVPKTPDTPVAFDIGVRVYDARAQQGLGSLQTVEAGLAFTSGQGQRSSRPLAVLYSQIAQGDRNGALCEYWRFTGSTPTGMVCN